MIVGFALLIAASGASAQQAGPPAKPVLKAEATSPAKELNAVPQAQPETSADIASKVAAKRKAQTQVRRRSFANRQAQAQAQAQALAEQQEIQRQQRIELYRRVRQNQQARESALDSEFLRQHRKETERAENHRRAMEMEKRATDFSGINRRK
jgi:acyl-CoA reductase-like NAD-dependent aldehyde dehydrogenase